MAPVSLVVLLTLATSPLSTSASPLGDKQDAELIAQEIVALLVHIGLKRINRRNCLHVIKEAILTNVLNGDCFDRWTTIIKPQRHTAALSHTGFGSTG